jgi:AraC family transcriptional activator FtrA
MADVMQWASAHLHEPMTVSSLAARAAMSPSTFHRRFLAEVGVTPLRWLHGERIDHARTLLETTDLGVEDIARACGFGTATSLRTHFHRQTGLAPTAYRRSHAA